MKASLGHLQMNIDFEKNAKFYKDMMIALGWNVIHESDDALGFSLNDTSIWFMQKEHDVVNDYDGPGLNHMGLQVENQKDVDTFMSDFMKPNNVQALFDTPRYREDFAIDKNSTYYQVMFKTPDNILVEILYAGSK